MYGHRVTATEFSRNQCEVKMCFLGIELKVNLITTEILSKDINYLTRLRTKTIFLEIYT